MNSLVTPSKVLELQSALHAKAKAEASYRFYSLYDKIYRKDVLKEAWRRCKCNGGASGVDRISFEMIEADGVEQWLASLAKELREKTYSPNSVRRVLIPKSNGKMRPLGIATIKDRVAQMAATLVLYPIFEADMPKEQYGYRNGKSANDAIKQIHSHITEKHGTIIDADLSRYFDTIPHRHLMKTVSRRISDKALLTLIKRWLVVAVEKREKGNSIITNPAKRTKCGTPQGSPISPLLSNLYMRRFVLGWKFLGLEKELSAKIVSYADDFVICCKGEENGQKALTAMQQIMSKLELEINWDKTKICNVWQESFDFLGYTFEKCYSWKDGRKFIGTKPSKTSLKRMYREISHVTRTATKQTPVEEQIKRMNMKLNGWANYFHLGVCSVAYQNLDFHSRYRLRQWLRRKYKLLNVPKAKFTDGYLHEDLGLTKLGGRKRNFPCVKA